MYIPDLFGAYIKGRELAIEKNWQDLKNYEAVESARNQNDLQALQILGERADFGGKRSMFRDQVDNSKRINEVAEYAQPGVLANTRMRADDAIIKNGVFQNNRQTYGDTLNAMFQAQLGKQGTMAGVQSATNAYWTPERQYNAGQAQGQVGYNAVMANGAASTDFVPAAQRQIAQNQANHGVNMASAQYQLGEAKNAIANQPAVHELGRTRISNEQWAQENLISQQQAAQLADQQNAMNQAYREYVSYLQKAQAGDPVAAQAASYLARQYGFDGLTAQTDPTGKTLIPTPAQQANNTQAVIGDLIPQMQERLANTYPYPVVSQYGNYQPTAPVQAVAQSQAVAQPVANTPTIRAPWLGGGALGVTGTTP